MNYSVVGVGHEIPNRTVTNETLEKELYLKPGWIESRTGIVARPIAAEEMATSDLAVSAGARAFRGSAVAPKDIGLVILATSTPDYPLPPTAPMVAHRLGCTAAGAFDLAGACSGFLYGLSIADAYCKAHQTPVIVIAANKLSSRVNPRDPDTVSVFSDGAAAVIWGPVGHGRGLRSVYLGSSFDHEQDIRIAAGGSRHPINKTNVAAGEHLMSMENGSRLFRDAVKAMTSAGSRALRQAQLTANELDWWIPHQANQRLLDEVGKRLKIPSEKTVSTIRKLGNNSAATVPMALSLYMEKGCLHPRQRLLLTAVGSGLTFAGLVLDL